METEIWKPVVGYEWLYEVSSFGRVKSLIFHNGTNERISKLYNHYWYHRVWLCKNWISKHCTIHRLVAKAFILNPENKPQVNHINWIKTDNRLENLEWCTSSENIQHAYKTWLMKVSKNNHFYYNYPGKWKNWDQHFNSKWIIQYSKDWEFIREWWSITNIHIDLWIQITNITKCCRFKRKSAWWYIWRYL